MRISKHGSPYADVLGISLERFMDNQNLIDEVWKPVTEFDGFYVSNLGRLRRTSFIKNWKEHIIKPKSNGNGYWMFTFYVNGKSTYRYVHRTVAEYFVDNPSKKPEVDHLNGNRADNRAVNLEWVTHMENQFNQITADRANDNRPSIPIVQMTVLCEYITTWDSANQAGRFLHISPISITANANHPEKCISASGYIFMKESDYIKNGAKLPLARSASFTIRTGVPSLYSVAVICNDRILNAFASTTIAAKFYGINESSIKSLCMRGKAGKFNKEQFYFKSFKDLDSDQQMIVRRLLYGKRKMED